MRSGDLLRGPPATLTVAYRRVGAGHVFTVEGLPGIHIGGSSVRRAFALLPKAIETHLRGRHGDGLRCEMAISFERFAKGALRPDVRIALMNATVTREG